MATGPPKPPERLLKLARQGLPKARRQRTAAEQKAINRTRAWRQWKKSQGGGGGQAWLNTPPMTQAQMMQQAMALAQGDLVPEEQALAREGQRAAQEAAAQQGLLRQLTADLGATVAPMAGNMQAAYQQAAQAQGQLAQGFSGAMESVAQQEAARNAADLAKWGGSAAAGDVAQASQGASDPLYGVGGFLPGSSLAQQGASWGAYGAAMPGVVARMGQQDAGNVASSYAALQKELSDRAAELAAKLPGLRAQYMEQLKQDELSKGAYRQAMKELGLRVEDQAFEQGIQASQNQLDWEQFQSDRAADAAQAAAERREARRGKKSTVKQRREAREALAALFASRSDDVTERTTKVTKSLWTDAETRTKVSLPEAVKIVRNMFAKEILEVKRAGVTEAAITNLIRKFLASIGFNTVGIASSSIGSAAGSVGNALDNIFG